MRLRDDKHCAVAHSYQLYSQALPTYIPHQLMRPSHIAHGVQGAANSALGRMLIKMASLQGVKNINLVRRKEAAKELKDQGYAPPPAWLFYVC